MCHEQSLDSWTVVLLTYLGSTEFETHMCLNPRQRQHSGAGLDINSKLVSLLTVTLVCFSNDHLITCRLVVPPTSPVMSLQLPADLET